MKSDRQELYESRFVSHWLPERHFDAIHLTQYVVNNTHPLLNLNISMTEKRQTLQR